MGSITDLIIKVLAEIIKYLIGIFITVVIVIVTIFAFMWCIKIVFFIIDKL